MQANIPVYLKLMRLLLWAILPAAAGVLYPAPLTAADLSWSEIKTPHEQFSEGTSIDFLVKSPEALFIYDNATGRLAKIRKRRGFLDVCRGPEQPGRQGNNGSAASGKYLAAATAEQAFISRDGGSSFNAVTPFHGMDIQCAAVSPSLDGNGFLILAGTPSGLWIYTSATDKWEDQSAVAGTGAKSLPAGRNAIGAAFSPNFIVDAAVLAVTVEGGATRLHCRRIISNKWDDSFGAVPVLDAGGFTRAAIDFPADFNISDNPRVFTGLRGGVKEDVYRVTLNTTSWTDLNVGGAAPILPSAAWQLRAPWPAVPCTQERLPGEFSGQRESTGLRPGLLQLKTLPGNCPW